MLIYILFVRITLAKTLRFVNGLYENKRIDNLFLILNDVSSGSGVYEMEIFLWYG